MEIDKVDLSKCMPNKDFGCGFYTTLLEEQAWRMAPVSYTHLDVYKRQWPEGSFS